jgi:hypothetical protein
MKAFQVKVQWLDGKCSEAPPIGRYSTASIFEKNSDPNQATWSVTLQAFKRNHLGGFDEAIASFLFPNAPHDWMKVGTEFKMMEGARPTAIVTVLKVYGAPNSSW